jgi:hypothetical protein
VEEARCACGMLWRGASETEIEAEEADEHLLLKSNSNPGVFLSQ